MAKPTEKLDQKRISAYPVATTVRKGMTVKIVSGVASETTGVDAEGIALDAGSSAASRNFVRVHRFGAGIVPVLCSASISAGATVKPATDGVAAATVGGGQNKIQVVGTLVDAGASGQLAGCDLGNRSHTVGS